MLIRVNLRSQAGMPVAGGVPSERPPPCACDVKKQVRFVSVKVAWLRAACRPSLTPPPQLAYNHWLAG